MKYRCKSTLSLLTVISALSIFSAPAEAATYQLGNVFSDPAEAPAGSGPWLTFSSTKMNDMVTIEFEANLTGSEYVSEWYINLDPALNPSNLVFSNPIKTGDFDLPKLAFALNAYKADGDGFYDIKLTFSPKNSERFNYGEKLSYQVSYSGGTIEETSFSFLSEPGGEIGPFTSAAHVRGTVKNGSGSAWISSVPEPTTALYTMVAAGICLTVRRRRPAAQAAD
jgi:hypothetical protein